MDSLKFAADKIKKSPRVMKKKIDSALNKDKLSDDWIHNRENVQNGVTFNVKVLGRRPAKDPKSENATDSVVEELVQLHQKNSKTEKLQKVALMVDSKKLMTRDLLTHELEEDIPVYRISYCTADPKYPKVFSFIARERATKNLFTHVFLTNKKAMAEAIALTVAQAFTMAYEEWEEKSNERKNQVENDLNEDAKDLYEGLGDHKKRSTKKKTNPFKPENVNSSDDDFGFVTNTLTPKVQEVTVEDPSPDQSDEDDDFLIFAQTRNEKKLNTGLVRKATFKGNVRDYLAVNNTAADLERATSSEDLFTSSSNPSPANDLSTNPFTCTTSNTTSSQNNVSSANYSEPAVGNLIEF